MICSQFTHSAPDSSSEVMPKESAQNRRDQQIRVVGDHRMKSAPREKQQIAIHAQEYLLHTSIHTASRPLRNPSRGYYVARNCFIIFTGISQATTSNRHHHQPAPPQTTRLTTERHNNTTFTHDNWKRKNSRELNKQQTIAKITRG
jgi:hypothetical protein